MSTLISNSSKRLVAVLMSFLLGIAALLPVGGGTAYARGSYTPITPVSSGYNGALTWMNYTAPYVPSLPPVTVTTNVYVPLFLDIDSENNIFVTMAQYTGISNATTSVGKVAKISNNGQTETDITYNGDFHYPIGIDVDNNGNVYVVDNHSKAASSTATATIKMLPHGSNSWIPLGPPLTYVYGIAVDHQGTVYAVEYNKYNVGNVLTGPDPRIKKLTSGSSSWVEVTGSAALINSPTDVAVDGEGNLFVSGISSNGSSNNGKIFKFPVGGSAWVDVSPKESGAFIPFFAYGIGVDKFDNLHAINLQSGSIERPFDGSAMKLSYNGGNTDWTKVQAMYNPQLPQISLDIAADSSGHIYGTSFYTMNIVRLMAAVVYDGNGNALLGGTPPTDNTGYLPGVTATVYGNINNMTKPGYTFSGWSKDPAATAASYTAGATIEMNQSVTLYAVWSPIPAYTVTYQTQTGGTLSGSVIETVYSGNSPLAVPTVTTDPGYTFLGWSSDGGTTLLTRDELAATAVTGNVTYTARVQAPVVLTGIELDSTSYSLGIGGTHQTVVKAVYSDNNKYPLTSGVTYSSSQTSIATVDSEGGLVTAVAEGETVITAVYGEFQAEATVNVSAPSTNPITTNPTKEVEVYVDGVKQDTLATLKEDTVGGQKVSTIVVDSQKVIEKMEKDSNKTLTLPLSGDSQAVVGQLTGALVKSLESNDAVIEIVTDRGTYKLPASQINIDSISAQVGANVKLEDIMIEIRISATTEENASKVEANAKANNFELIGKPVDFEVTATYGQTSIDANKFNSYVERTISLPDGIDPNSITTGVVLTAKGELFHTPTIVTQKDGKMYATINSLTNSTYSVIHNPREMDDVITHWARADVNDMNSRLVIQGVTETEFRPDAAITRAEFAAIVTRGLGIQGATYTGSFSDAAATDWYAEAVQAAVNYKLFDGYEDGKFRPNQNISRQEATAVLTRTASLAKLKTELPAAEVSRLLSQFTDGSEVASWAQANVAAAISLNLMNGRGDTLDVSANLTRAETAALIRRLLQAANLINK